MNIGAERFSQAKRIVIKVGASSLIDLKTGHFNTLWLNNLADCCDQLMKEGREVIIVSSGAVMLGCNIIGMSFIKAKLQDKQTASSVGQIELMQRYKETFTRKGINVAQIILTIEDVENRKRYLSARKVIDQLLKKKVIPVVNQNDVIATAEIRFGDNDRLSARVAQISNADMLVLYSNVDGLYTSDPTINKYAEFIKEVYEVNSDIENMAGDSPSGSGGMSAKVASAKIALNARCNAVIINSKNPNSLRDIVANEKATWFLPDVDSHSKYLKA